jgi:hypothetical protein
MVLSVALELQTGSILFKIISLSHSGRKVVCSILFLTGN